MSYSRISLYRRTDGGFLTTIKAQPEYSWVLNAYGQCSFDLPIETLKTARRYMEFGTLVYIENEKLGNWGGVLDTDEDWNDDGTVTKNAYTGEYLLTFRRSPLNRLFRDATSGGLFKQMINQANLDEDLLIREGVIWRGGSPAEDTMDGKDIYSHVKALVEGQNRDYSIDPALDENGRLYFRANFYERMGETETTVLKEGYNIQKRSSPLKVQRKIVNDLLGVGAGSDDERATWKEIDAGSRNQYGLRQGSEDFSGVVDGGALKSTTAERLRVLRQPRRTFRIDALDVGDTHKALRRGNILPLQMQTVGLLSDDQIGVDTSVRVLGIRHVTKTDAVELTVDEVI